MRRIAAARERPARILPPTPTALLIVKKRTIDPGRVGDVLQTRGYALAIRCPNDGDAQLADFARHDAACGRWFARFADAFLTAPGNRTLVGRFIPGHPGW